MSSSALTNCVLCHSRAKSYPPSVLEMKFYWNTAPSIHLYIVHGCFHTMTELSSCKRSCMACKAQDIYHLALYRKSLLTPALTEKMVLQPKNLENPVLPALWRRKWIVIQRRCLSDTQVLLPKQRNWWSKYSTSFLNDQTHNESQHVLSTYYFC